MKLLLSAMLIFLSTNSFGQSVPDRKIVRLKGKSPLCYWTAKQALMSLDGQTTQKCVSQSPYENTGEFRYTRFTTVINNNSTSCRSLSYDIVAICL